MAMERPTRSQLVQQLQAAIESRLTSEQLRHSDAKVYARAFAGTADAVFSLVSYMHRQQFVFSCDSEYLDRHAALYGLTRKPAEFAEGHVQFDVSAGGVVPAGTVVQTADGVRFVTTEDDQSGISHVRAELAGVAGNADAGIEVNLLSPLAGVASIASVSSRIEGGIDIESDDEFRSRTLQKMRDTPMGGSESDYVTWALAVPGVTRAWCYPLEDGDGTVTVRFVCDNEDDIIPNAEMVDRVSKYIGERRPVCARVSVVAPTKLPVDFSFSLLSPNTVEVKERIRANLHTYFANNSEPGRMIPLSQLRAIISNTVGEDDSVLISPSSNILPDDGQLPVLGEIVWP